MAGLIIDPQDAPLRDFSDPRDAPSLSKAKTYIPQYDYKANGYKPMGTRTKDANGKTVVTGPEEHFCSRCVNYYKRLADAGLYPKGKWSMPCKGDVSWKVQKYQDIDPAELGMTEEEFDYFLVSLDPVRWVEYEFGMKLDWYQSDIARCSNLWKAVRGGRRIGKSTVLGTDILYSCYTKWGMQIPRYEYLVVCPYEAQVKKIFDNLEMLVSQSTNLKAAVKAVRKSPHWEMEFHNGSIARGFSSGKKTGARSDKIRGQDAHCVVAGTLVNTTEYAVRPIETMRVMDPIFGGGTKLKQGIGRQFGVNPDQAVLVLPTVLSTITCTPDHPVFDGQRDVLAQDATQAVVSLAHRDLNFQRSSILARLIGYAFGDGWVNTRSVGFSGQAEDLEQIVEDLCLLGDVRHKITTSYKENEDLGIAGWVSEFCSSWAYRWFNGDVPAGQKVLQSLRVPEWIRTGKDMIRANFLSGLFSAEGTGVEYQTNGRTPRPPEINMRSIALENLEAWFADLAEMLHSLNIEVAGPYFEKISPTRWRGNIRVRNGKDNIDRFVSRIGYCYNVEKARSANVWRLYRHYEATWNGKSWKKNRRVRQMAHLTASETARALKIPLSTVKYHRNLYDPLYSEPKATPQEVADHHAWKPGYLLLPILTAARRMVGRADVYNMDSSASHRFFANGLLTHNSIGFDEIDYMADEDIEAIFAVLGSQENVRLWMSTTPTGARSKFWRVSTDKTQGFKEFHFISNESPRWTPQAERFFKAMYSQGGYDREFNAEFGTPTEGVFRQADLDACLRDYDYEDCSHNSDRKYVIGVDWNKLTGTHIVVVEGDYKDRSHARFAVVDKRIIRPQEFTQMAGVEAVLELDRQWGADFVYVDAGYGAVQVEMLHRLDKQHPMAGMRYAERVVSVNMAEKVEFRDPRNPGRWIKKAAKPFMVDMLAGWVSSQQIVFPAVEDTDVSIIESEIAYLDIGLIQQMREFKVEKVSPTGQVRYSQGYEHTLVALALACMGHALQFSELNQNIVHESIRYTDISFGTKRDETMMSVLDEERRKKVDRTRRVREETKPGRNVLEKPASGRQDLFFGPLRPVKRKGGFYNPVSPPTRRIP